MIDLNRQMRIWLEAGVISEEQAELMRGSVPVAGERREHGSRIPIIAEILGYVGAALAIWAVVFLVSEFWANLSDWAQTAMFGALSLVLIAAGATILDHEEPALRRLSSVLWSVGVVAMVGAFYIVFDPILGMSVAATWMTIGAISSVVAGVMLWRQEMPAQHIVLFGATLTTVMWAMNLLIEPEFFAYGLVAWGVGLIWILVSRAGVLPRGTAIVLGSVTMFIGAQLIAGDVEAFGILLGLLTAALFAAAGVTFEDRIAIILGGIGIFWFVPQAMFYFLGDAIGGMFGLFSSGVVMVAFALWFSRRREAS